MITSEGVILRVVDFRETDRIVSIYTRDLGKVSALARHVTNSRRRFGTMLSSFNLVSLTLRQKSNRSLLFLEQVRPLASLAGIYQDWRRIAAACAIADFVNEMTREGNVNPAIYEQSAASLLRLNRGEPWLKVLATFQYELLDAAGFRPAISRCVHCHCDFDQDADRYWVQRAGGMHCKTCLPRAVPYEQVPFQLHQALDLLEQRRDELDEQSIQPCATMLYHFIRHQLGHPVRSWEFMDRVGMLNDSNGLDT